MKKGGKNAKLKIEEDDEFIKATVLFRRKRDEKFEQNESSNQKRRDAKEADLMPQKGGNIEGGWMRMSPDERSINDDGNAGEWMLPDSEQNDFAQNDDTNDYELYPENEFEESQPENTNNGSSIGTDDSAESGESRFKLINYMYK